MGNIHRPRHGSIQYWPRKKAARNYARVRAWKYASSKKLLGFAGYKAGMTHVNFIDNSTSVNKGSLVSYPVTIVECPPLKTLSLRFYKNTHDGLKLISEIFSKKYR